MPKKPSHEKKKPVLLRLSPESLSYIKTIAHETRRDLTNVIEYLIYLHSNKTIPEPIPFYPGKRPKDKTQNQLQAHDSNASELQATKQQDTPIFFNEERENPYAKDE